MINENKNKKEMINVGGDVNVDGSCSSQTHFFSKGNF